jgi:hypothetical protein
MDYLDPRKNFQNKVLLITGYILIFIAIVLATVVLLYQSYGYGIHDGRVIQNGLIFLNSQPNPANIYVNNVFKGTTNTNLTLESGVYNFELTLNGFRTWTRKIEIDGGTIAYYDYPLLIPDKLKSTIINSSPNTPLIFTESLNKQYVLILNSGSNDLFDLYNLSSSKPSLTKFSVPANIISKNTSGTSSWNVIGWANDNSHVLLEHSYDGTKTEYILLDVTNPSNSINLSTQFASFSFSSINFINLNYKNYYLYNQTTQTLDSVSLSNPGVETNVLNNVLSYDGYLSNTILYATTTNAPTGLIYINEMQGSNIYHIRTFPAGSTYLLNMASYSGTIYVAAGSSALDKVYIYQDPVSQLQNLPNHVPVPIQVLFVKDPNYLNFSENSQFIVAEGYNQFGVYDFENLHGYNYITKLPLDPPQTHAFWMDGDRMTYVSNGKLIMFEYDHNYRQILVPSLANFAPAFDSNYHNLYTISYNPITKTYNFEQTSLI